MRSLLLSTYDTAGGAARAAYRLHQGLQRQHIQSHMLVQSKFSDDASVIESYTKLGKLLSRSGHALDAIPPALFRQRQKTEFSTQWVPDLICQQVQKLNPDIINLHWVNESFVRIETLASLNKPIVWTLHDMWAFTGGCHYDQGCSKYTLSCGSCPQLGSSWSFDLSHWVWKRKHQTWHRLPITIVALSQWMADCVKASSLFKNCRIEIIPNGIDTQVYKPIARNIARQLLNLPQDKSLVLFGAINATSSPRKGFDFLQQALLELKQTGVDLELLILGSSRPEVPPDLGFKTHYLGKLGDDTSLALVYSAADVFVAPSTQDNLPNTIMEALACGTPSVGFKIGGIPDMVEHCLNGYLAYPFDVSDLARGIKWTIEDEERHQKISENARNRIVKSFSQDIQANRYIDLFTDCSS